MNERRRILSSELAADAVTLRVTTTDGSTNVGIEMTVTNGNTVYPVTTDSQGKAVITGLSGGCTIDCTTHVLSVTQFTATGTMTVDISAYVDTFPVGEVRTYGYTATVAEVPVVPGTYKMQVWGAQGGSGSSYTGGKGGYSEGIVTIPSPMTLYVFVGGQGSTSGNGGWNGGGGSSSGYSSYNSGGDSGYSYFGCGGGATDIATVTSTMSYSSYRTARDSASLLARMIVAGGGSGGSYAYRSYTTSSTTTVTDLSVSNGNAAAQPDNGNCIVDNFYENRYLLVDYPCSPSYTYTLTSNASGMCMYVEFTNSTGARGSSASIQQKQLGYSGTYTLYPPSGTQYINVFTNNINAFSGFNVSLKHTVTTSSTSTSSDYTYGYVGGGVNGGGYSSTYYGQQSAAGSNGAFGLGANQTVTNYRYAGGCGGGGWYGGGNTYSDSGISTCRYSGGGSGFVNTAASAGNRPTGYTGLQLDSGETKAGNTSFPNTAGTGNETGHAGNGYAKITRIAAYSVTLRFKDEEDSPVTGASVTVSNSEYTYSLTTDSNGEATSAVINGTYNVSCQGYSLDVTSISVTGNQTFSFNATELLDFTYTGAAQTKTLKAGTYKIECWGAQGGYSYSTSYPGGKGGYSVGELTLTENTTLYIYVGGKGTDASSSGTGVKSGGFNGGGQSYVTNASNYPEGAGGGASDVRIGSTSLYARVIVAGGGGGAGSYSSSYRYAGGAGGGTTGVTPSQYSTSYRAGTGGTQTTYGTSYYGSTANSTSYGTIAAFGVGAGSSSTSYQISGGGGGWYGGGYSRRGAGGGGSGYVYNSSTASNYPSGCLLNSSHYLANSQTIAGNASMPSTSGSTETGHSGNGYVRITKISHTVTLHFETEGQPLEGATITVTATGMNMTATTNASGNAVFQLPDGTYTVSCAGYSLDSTSLTVSGNTSESYEATEKIQWVDLGLPSGLLWATGNLVKDASGNYGIGEETDWGTYVSWANVVGHNEGEGYDFSDSIYQSTTGYSQSTDIASNDSSHDIALNRLGAPMRLPSKDDFQELYDECTWTWTAVNGVNGYNVVSKSNGNSIFLAASGFYDGTSLSGRSATIYGRYWSSSRHGNSTKAYYLNFRNVTVSTQDYDNRRFGLTIRPVKPSSV